jgi:ElaB/YqjD/DUF883 family membrane-anchored ribosome-binding protein
MTEEENVSKADMDEIRAKMDALKKDLAELADLTKEKVVGGATAWSKEHPASAVGIIAGVSAAVGLALGLLLGRD